jgi:dienelactone hydrolase
MLTFMNSLRSLRSLGWLLVGGWLGGACLGEAASLRALPEGQRPADIRLKPLKDLNGYFPFTPPKTTKEWTQRAEHVRQQMRVALGLWPRPERTPLNAVIHGRMARDGYTVEKVFFESMPGFFVTGNLYRPARAKGRVPGVLCPHGHWNGGRFMNASDAEVKKQLKNGAEIFANGARSPLQARCVQLARMGCVVFHYDMIGYADSVQIPRSLAHGFRKQRPEMNRPTDWGLFSPQAEARFQSVMGLQTWNSMRALDFLISLPDVDSQRLAVTGASGGGTQTFILCALDPRPAVAFPAVMVSTAMQGGCTCENACNLRINTGNVEFAALFAPKPLGMTCANDWTVEMPTKGFPELQALYRLLKVPDRVMLKDVTQFGHNYNAVSRAAMYDWFNRHLGLGLPTPVKERDFPLLSRAEMTVWDQEHPAPKGGPEFERGLLRWWNETAQKQLRRAGKRLDTFQAVYGTGLKVVLGRTLSEVGRVTWTQTGKETGDGWRVRVGLVRNQTHQEELPAVFVEPVGPAQNVVVWITGRGKAGLFGPDGRTPRKPVLALVRRGSRVIGADLLEQGEFRPDGQPLRQTRRVNNPRESAAYTFGYNYTLFARRVQDVLTLIRLAQTHGETVTLFGTAGGGRWAGAALAVAEGAVDAAVIDTEGFRFAHVDDLRDPDFLPGGAKYGDLPGMIATGLPRRLTLRGEAEVPKIIRVVAELQPQHPQIKLLKSR